MPPRTPLIINGSGVLVTGAAACPATSCVTVVVVVHVEDGVVADAVPVTAGVPVADGAAADTVLVNAGVPVTDGAAADTVLVTAGVPVTDDPIAELVLVADATVDMVLLGLTVLDPVIVFENVE